MVPKAGVTQDIKTLGEDGGMNLETNKKYYHGGVRGLKKGDKLLPPCTTGKSTLLEYSKEIDPNGDQRDDRVYLTTYKKMAKLYAAMFPRGDVYEVIPDGQLEDDPDCLKPGLSYQCTSGTIKRVHDLSVRF
jgi:hypothetical protein